MNLQRFFFSFCGLLVGLAIGFLVANSIASAPRTNLETSKSSVTNFNAAIGGNDDSALTLSAEELRNAISKGDASPRDSTLQLNLGRALYLYATHSRDARLLPEALRFVKRAVEAKPVDHESNVLMGSILFDIAQMSESKRFDEARQAYLRALRAKPADADVLMELGRTYHFAKPADTRSAISFYEKALAVDARHEAAMQNLINALLDANRRADAERRLEELQQVNPSNPGLSNLKARLAQTQNAEHN